MQAVTDIATEEAYVPRCPSIYIETAHRDRPLTNAAQRLPRSTPMLDVIMLAITFVFFALSIAYVYACDQL